MNIIDKLKTFFYRLKITCDPLIRRSKGFAKKNPIIASGFYIFIAFLIIHFFIDRGLLKFLSKENISFFSFISAVTKTIYIYLVLIALYAGFLIAAGIALSEEKFEKFNSISSKMLIVLKNIAFINVIVLILKLIFYKTGADLFLEKEVYDLKLFAFTGSNDLISLQTSIIFGLGFSVYQIIENYLKIIYIVCGIISFSIVLAGDTYLSSWLLGAYTGIVYGILMMRFEKVR